MNGEALDLPFAELASHGEENRKGGRAFPTRASATRRAGPFPALRLSESQKIRKPIACGVTAVVLRASRTST